jgi:hypothetical protein
MRLTNEMMETGEVVVQLKDTKRNRMVLDVLKCQLEEMFSNELVIVGVGEKFWIKLRSHGQETENQIRQMVRIYGGTIR